MQFKVTEVVDSWPFQSQHGEKTSWLLIGNDNAGLVYQIKINTTPPNDYAVGDVFDINFTGGKDWVSDDVTYQVAVKPQSSQVDKSGRAGGAAPQPVPQQPPLPGYRPPAQPHENPKPVGRAGYFADIDSLVEGTLRAAGKIIDGCGDEIPATADAALETGQKIATTAWIKATK